MIQDSKKIEKLIEEIMKITYIIKANNLVPYDERQLIANKVAMTLLLKQDYGSIQLDDYNAYKGFLFICTRNEIYKYNNMLIYKQKKNDCDFDFDIQPSHQSDTHLSFKLDMVNKYIKKLPPVDRAIVRWHLKRGWQKYYVCEAMEINVYQFDLAYNKVMKKMRRQLTWLADK